MRVKQDTIVAIKFDRKGSPVSNGSRAKAGEIWYRMDNRESKQEAPRNFIRLESSDRSGWISRDHVEDLQAFWVTLVQYACVAMLLLGLPAAIIMRIKARKKLREHYGFKFKQAHEVIQELNNFEKQILAADLEYEKALEEHKSRVAALGESEKELLRENDLQNAKIVAENERIEQEREELVQRHYSIAEDIKLHINALLMDRKAIQNYYPLVD